MLRSVAVDIEHFEGALAVREGADGIGVRAALLPIASIAAIVFEGIHAANTLFSLLAIRPYRVLVSDPIMGQTPLTNLLLRRKVIESIKSVIGWL